MDDAGYETAMQFYFGPLADAVKQQYPVDSFPTPSDAMAAAVTDMLFACPSRAVRRWAADYTPTYAYGFSDCTALSYPKSTSFALGASHTFELAYLFPGFHGSAGIPVMLECLAIAPVRTDGAAVDQHRPGEH
ncbi:carboxylesterase family protein [Pseudomonas sp. NY15354]|uniref:carboxylesterase family protein n=1 Tax=Pseudomonas sp. NY15354 TaxID=3400351 RepID=UPI003A83E35E